MLVPGGAAQTADRLQESYGQREPGPERDERHSGNRAIASPFIRDYLLDEVNFEDQVVRFSVIAGPRFQQATCQRALAAPAIPWISAVTTTAVPPGHSGALPNVHE